MLMSQSLFSLTAAREAGDTVLSSLWQQESAGNRSIRKMNGEDTGIGGPTPAVVGYLGKVSYTQFSNPCHVCKARCHLQIDLYWMLYGKTIDCKLKPPYPCPNEKRATRKSVKGERIVINKLWTCYSYVSHLHISWF